MKTNKCKCDESWRKGDPNFWGGNKGKTKNSLKYPTSMFKRKKIATN